MYCSVHVVTYVWLYIYGINDELHVPHYCLALFGESLYILCTYQSHAPPTPYRAHIGD